MEMKYFIVLFNNVICIYVIRVKKEMPYEHKVEFSAFKQSEKFKYTGRK